MVGKPYQRLGYMSTKITNRLFQRDYQAFGSSAAMSLAQNVQRFRRRKKLSQAKLAEMIGARQNTIAAIESGHTKRTKLLPELAQVLGVSIPELDPSLEVVENATIPGNQLVGPADLPVYSSTDAGDGVVFVSERPVQTVRRPEPLATVSKGYGVIVAGESMVPLVRPGDTVLVHPHLPPKAEDWCLFIGENHGEFRATLKEYLGQTADLWKVKRYFPKEQEFTLKKRDFPRCEVVVGKYNRR
jgi:transcriptional regulator with XRE-family HTH domain